jgi:hypothetical protein
MKNILRIARPSDNLSQVALMYKNGFGFEILSEFKDHNGFDGVILGHSKATYHLEFTHHYATVVGRAPTQDNLLVWYVPEIAAYKKLMDNLLQAGFIKVASYNPYWDQNGSTFEDCDGYRVVITLDQWVK